MGKGKKLLLLLLVVALLVGGYFAVQYFLNKDDTQDDSKKDTVPIQAMQTDDVVGILYVCGDEKIELEKVGETWMLKSDRKFPVNQAYADTMAADAATLEALRLVSESADDFVQYGLDEPETAYVFTLADNSQVTYYIGNYNSFGSTYYMNVAGTEKIYLISGDLLDDFSHDLSDLADVEEMKSVATEDIHALTLTLDGEMMRLFYSEDGLDTVYSDLFTWFLDERTPADATAAQDLVGKAASYAANGCADYMADDDDLAAFGLDAPVLTATFDYTVSEEKETGETDENGEAVTETVKHDETLTLLVGSEAKDGSLYARTYDSDAVYLIGADYLKTLREFDRESLRSKRVCAVKSTDVESMNVTIGGKTSTITVTRTKDESDKQTVSYKMDGKAIDSGKYDTFYAAIQSVNAESFTDKKASAEDATISVVFHTTRKGFETISLRLKPFDQNFYVDSHGALVNKRDAQKIVKTFETIGEK